MVGRRACGVYCLLSTVNSLCVVWCVFQCGVCVVLLCCVVGYGMAGCGRVRGLVVCLLLLSVFLFSFLLLVFGVVRAQLCEHARYPRTPLRLSCCLLLFSVFSCLLFLAPRLSSVGMAVCDSPCVGVPSWHDGYG